MIVENNHWIPSVSDPNIIGWITVAIYFIVAIICLKAAFIPIDNNLHQEKIKRFWLFLTFFLIALGINKQLDLQTLFTQLGKNISIEQGWYENRRLVQLCFIILIGIICITSITLLLKIYKRSSAAIKTSLISCIILFSFILIRASSFHYIDSFINITVMSIKMDWLLELGGLATIGIGGFQYSQSKNINDL